MGSMSVWGKAANALLFSVKLKKRQEFSKQKILIGVTIGPWDIKHKDKVRSVNAIKLDRFEYLHSPAFSFRLLGIRKYKNVLIL